MVSASTVNSDKEQILTVFNKYIEIKDKCTTTDVWDGASRNNFVSKAEEFVATYKNNILNQMSDLSSAVTKVKKYKEKKEELKSAENNYNAALNNGDTDLANMYASQISNIKAEMATLKTKIDNLLENIKGLCVSKLATYPTNNEEFSKSVVESAEALYRHAQEKGYAYVSTSEKTYTFPVSDKQTSLSCATFVQQSLIDAGYKHLEGSEKIYAWQSPTTAKEEYEKLGFEVEIIDEPRDFQAGDILNAKGSEPHTVIVSERKDNDTIVTYGFPEANNPEHKNGKVRTTSDLNSNGYYAVRIKGVNEDIVSRE